jgi:hypothetical protein
MITQVVTTLFFNIYIYIYIYIYILMAVSVLFVCRNIVRASTPDNEVVIGFPMGPYGVP